MYLTMSVFSKNCVFQNPETKKHASLFIHNTTAVIVADNNTIVSTSNREAIRILNQLGYTVEVHDGHGDFNGIDL